MCFSCVYWDNRLRYGGGRRGRKRGGWQVQQNAVLQRAVEGFATMANLLAGKGSAAVSGALQSTDPQSGQ